MKKNKILPFIYSLSLILCFSFINNLTVNALVEGCITSGTSLRGSAYLGSRLVGSNYYYEFASGVYDSSPLNVDFCTEWQQNGSATGTKKVNFVVEYCVNGAPPTLEIWSSYYNSVDYTYFTGKSIYLTDGEWSRAQCYRSFVSLNLNYEDNIGTSGLYNFTRFTNNNNTFAMIANYGYNVLLRYTDLIYYDSNDYNNLLLQTKDEVNSQTQINQNQTIIDQNNQTNEKLDSIIDSNVDDPSSSINSFQNMLATNGVITQLVTLPVTLFTKVLNSVNGACSNYNLGSLFGTDLILPCINIQNYLGSTLWSVIDVLISGLFVYAISRKFIKVFENLSSMKDGDVISD